MPTENLGNIPLGMRLALGSPPEYAAGIKYIHIIICVRTSSQYKETVILVDGSHQTFFVDHIMDQNKVHKPFDDVN